MTPHASSLVKLSPIAAAVVVTTALIVRRRRPNALSSPLLLSLKIELLLQSLATRFESFVSAGCALTKRGVTKSTSPADTAREWIELEDLSLPTGGGKESPQPPANAPFASPPLISMQSPGTPEVMREVAKIRMNTPGLTVRQVHLEVTKHGGELASASRSKVRKASSKVVKQSSRLRVEKENGEVPVSRNLNKEGEGAGRPRISFDL